MTSPTNPEILKGSVGIVGNKIACVTSDAERIDAFRIEHPDRREIDGTGKLLMPGLINTHCHVAMTLQRSMADDIELIEWLNKHIWPFEAVQTAEDVAVGAELGIAEMLLGGTTTFVDMYWDEPTIADVVQKTGIRALLGVCFLDSRMANFERELPQVVAKSKECSRVMVSVAPHAPYSCSTENLKRGVELSRQYNLPITTHIAESPSEDKTIRDLYGVSAVEYLDSLGVLNERTIAAHCIHLADNDIAILKARGVNVAHNPQSNMKISSGIAPIERLRSEGINCTIATDGTCSNNDLDMWDEVRSATFLQKVATMNPTAMPAYEALRMVTANSAKALGMEGALGVVKEGALADIILVDTEKPHFYPRHNIVNSLVYCGQAADVDTVIVDGEILVEERKIVGTDIKELCNRAEQTTRQIMSRIK